MPSSVMVCGVAVFVCVCVLSSVLRECVFDCELLVFVFMVIQFACVCVCVVLFCFVCTRLDYFFVGVPRCVRPSKRLNV